MRVFVLSAGRNGSMTFLRACRHIENFSSGHESRAEAIGEDRLNYSDQHIEIDNRLSWFLGGLDEAFGDEAVYVHLIRNREQTAASHKKRWNIRNSIVKAFCAGILMTIPETLNEAQRLQVAQMYYDTINANIRSFLKYKNQTLTVHLETIKEDFKRFWETIGAEGDLEAALREFDEQYNRSGTEIKSNLIYEMKLLGLRILRRFTISSK